MIKFFRRIRLDALSRKRYPKYLTYAIGEIILVVIGILIALGINNWNEKRKIKNEEKITLIKIENDLTADLLQFDYYKQTFKEIDQLHTDLYNFAQGNQTADSISELLLIRRSLYFKQLVSSDFKEKIKQINNKKIDEALTKYTIRVKDVEFTYSEQLESIINNRLKPLLYENEVYDPKSWFTWQKKGFTKDYSLTTISGKNLIDKERFLELVKTNEFQQLLFGLNTKWHEFNSRLDIVIEANKNFRELLKSELKNY